ncbi:RDD family protein [Thalassococcus sp. BH17M4-6]|uniref:RDD family protein n=1 Tax=Thalassococcus sp. BH17M4-6 TaxID=3413148 RepID=UPI003BD4B5B7
MHAYASHLPDPAHQPEFYATVPVKRAMAWVFDTLVTMALVVPAVVMTAFIGLFFLPVLYFTVGFIYRVLTIAGGSATWGMRLMSIELRDAQGQRFDLGQAFAHTAGYTFSLLVAPLQLVSAIFMCVTDRGQGLTDLALGSVMINRRA